MKIDKTIKCNLFAIIKKIVYNIINYDINILE